LSYILFALLIYFFIFLFGLKTYLDLLFCYILLLLFILILNLY